MKKKSSKTPPVYKSAIAPYVPTAVTELIGSRGVDVLKRIAEGKSTREVAHLLGVSVKTVETHRAQIMERLDIHDVPGLVRFAVRSGLVSADA